MTVQDIALGLTYYVALLFSVSFHESAHAWAALRMGDETARREGRINLNPIAHIDPIGTILMPMLQIFWGGIPLLAWAKPTPYNPGNFRRDVSLAQGHVAVAAAGPLSNVLLAFVFTVALFVGLQAGMASNSMNPGLRLILAGIQMNVALALFNLVPIPPLDGSKVASWGLPRSMGEAYDRVMEPYGMVILMLFVIINFNLGLMNLVIDPLTAMLIRAAL
ncbi:MAG: site-2 protease family protein [Acidobacteria bacterium]|nr:site-2 protease family protein [Acidobacteriota bacterium]